MRKQRLLLSAAMAGIPALLVGCSLTGPLPRIPATASSSTSTASEEETTFDPDPRYSGGRAMQDFPFPSRVVAAGFAEAMRDLEIKVVGRHRDGPASQLDGRTLDGRTVTVTFRPYPPVTHASCRIGWFGDEPMSRTLLHRAAVRLGTLPPEPIPEEVPSEPASNPYFSRDAVSDEEMMRVFIEAPYQSRPGF